MLLIDRSDVASAPFPHIVKQGLLPDALFRALKADFPTAEWFEEEDAKADGKGSRVGKGTGFDIYRGDSTYDRLVATSPAWAEFDAYINSPAFVEKFLDLFGDTLDELGCSVEIDPAQYDKDFVEGREVLTEKKTVKDMVGGFIHKLTGGKGGKVKLFSRLDIEKSMGGYAKPPHCDRSNRLCSLIVYFTDAEREGIEGGELNIYALKTPKPASDHARHPRPEDVDIVATLKPQENLGVFFPCSNNSYHGVNAVTSVGRARDFLYINISTASTSCW